MRGAVPPPPIRLHGVVLIYAQGQLYLTLIEFRVILQCWFMKWDDVHE
jgi:hypothetical protein